MTKKIPWLEFKNVDAWIDNKKIIEGLNLALNATENTVIIGPNGSGKSSIVKLIDRSIYPVVKKDSHIKFFGREKISLWDIRSKIGFLSTDYEYRIKNNQNVYNVISSGLYGSFSKIGKRKICNEEIEKVMIIINRLNLDDYKNQLFHKLSDGLKRMVLIGRSLVHDPKMLILDEPECRLDLKSKYSVIEFLEKISESGTTIIQITHNIETILKSTKRIILLKDGKVIGDGSPNACLTDKKISSLFETPLLVTNNNGYWQIFPAI